MARGLDEYNEKRDFSRTAEPEGGSEQQGDGLKFVVQHHSARTDHYDFRLEWKGVMRSWAIPKGPSYDPRERRLAVEVEDHPLEYRDFEGSIREGEYGAGAVMIWDEGYWTPQEDADKGLEGGNLKIVLHGKRLKGKWALIRMKAKASDTKSNWLLIKERDGYALDNAGISGFTASVRSGRTMEEISQSKAEEDT